MQSRAKENKNGYECRFAYLGILQNVVNQHDSAPSIEKFLYIRVEIQGHFLILIDATELWRGMERRRVL